MAEIRGAAIDTRYHTGLALDEVLATHGGSGHRTHLTDALGSVLARADEAGALRNRYAYSPYGECTGSAGPAERAATPRC